MEASSTPPQDQPEVHPGYERALRAREAHDRGQVVLNRNISRNREAYKKEYDEGEQGAIRRQIDEAERIMRLPTPEAMIASGQVPGDPTKGPSS